MRNFLHRKARSQVHRLHNQTRLRVLTRDGDLSLLCPLVFAVTPSQFTNTLIGGGTYAMNSSRLAGRDMKSERHLITGVCNCNATSCDYATCDNTTGVAQMWNWGFEEIVPLESLSNKTYMSLSLDQGSHRRWNQHHAASMSSHASYHASEGCPGVLEQRHQRLFFLRDPDS